MPDVNSLIIEKLRDGGFIIVSHSAQRGEFNAPVFASGEIGPALDYIKKAFVSEVRVKVTEPAEKPARVLEGPAVDEEIRLPQTREDMRVSR